MTQNFPITTFSPEQADLWRRVKDLWEMSLRRDEREILETLDPRYAGWDMSQPLPHGREAAAASVCGDTPRVESYSLDPLSVEVYDGTAGIVHYRYEASVAPKDAQPLRITGRWTEIYIKRDGVWIMIGVSGRPDPPEACCKIC